MQRALFAEFLGTSLLLVGVVGSGIMAANLTDDVGLQLLQNAIATGGALLALIWALGPVSGAHFNPVVTLADVALGDRPWRTAAPYVGAQVAGAAVGTVVANLMFDLPAVEFSTKDRSASHLWLGEVVATFGLVLLIFSLVRSKREHLAAPAVAGYIVGAYYFTSSTSFANPAVTIGRTLSDTFAGIDPASAPAFIVAQAIGATLAVAATRFLYPAGGTADVDATPVRGDR